MEKAGETKKDPPWSQISATRSSFCVKMSPGLTTKGRRNQVNAGCLPWSNSSKGHSHITDLSSINDSSNNTQHGLYHPLKQRILMCYISYVNKNSGSNFETLFYLFQTHSNFLIILLITLYPF